MFQNDDYVFYEEKQSHANGNKSTKENIHYALLVDTWLHCIDNLDVQCILQFSFGGHGSSKNVFITKEDPIPFLLIFPRFHIA